MKDISTGDEREMRRKIAEKWLKQALHDLKIARFNVEGHGYDVAAFLSHQAVEKLLKCLMILRDGQAPRTHYIDQLAEMLKLGDAIMSKVYELVQDYSFARYPDMMDNIPFEYYTEQIALEKIKAAEEVFEGTEHFYRDLLHESREG